MNSAFISYYSHIAKLAKVANKQTLFLAHLLYLMDYHEGSRMNIVSLTPFDRRRIIKEIDAKTDDPLRLAAQYLAKLQKSGLIKSIGGGAYMIDPASFGHSKYVPVDLRRRAAAIYETRVFKGDGDDGEFEAYIITDVGERIDLC